MNWADIIIPILLRILDYFLKRSEKATAKTVDCSARLMACAEKDGLLGEKKKKKA